LHFCASGGLTGNALNLATWLQTLMERAGGPSRQRVALRVTGDEVRLVTNRSSVLRFRRA
jgi:hypothetical protein